MLHCSTLFVLNEYLDVLVYSERTKIHNWVYLEYHDYGWDPVMLSDYTFEGIEEKN